MVAFGDMGKAEVDGSLEHWEEVPSRNTTDLIRAGLQDTDLVLHIGDISYAVGYSSQWDTFMDQIEPIASYVPYMTCIGNHERDFPNSGSVWDGVDSGGECGAPYETRFKMPRPSLDKPWYGFDHGNIHFTIMSTEHNFTSGSEQWNFLTNDLKSVDRSVTPWLVMAGHRPMYVDSNFTNDQYVATLLRQNLEDAMYAAKVDLALWGHHHSYQRMCQIYQGACVTTPDQTGYYAPYHMVIGMAGMWLSSASVPSTPPSWLSYIALEYGFTRIRTTSKTLTLEFVADGDGQTQDVLTIKKP
jgi:hypothetical protein